MGKHGGGSPARGASSRLRNSIRTAQRHEERIVTLPYERVHSVAGEPGSLSFITTGTAEGAKFNEEELRNMRGAIVTHNHPIARGHSRDDVALLYRSGARQVRAVTPQYVYVVAPPRGQRLTSNQWYLGNGNISGRGSRGAGDVYNAIWRGVAKQLQRDVQAGRRTPAEADNLLPHEIMVRLARATGLRYRRIAR